MHIIIASIIPLRPQDPRLRVLHEHFQIIFFILLEKIVEISIIDRLYGASQTSLWEQGWKDISLSQELCRIRRRYKIVWRHNGWSQFQYRDSMVLSNDDTSAGLFDVRWLMQMAQYSFHPYSLADENQSNATSWIRQRYQPYSTAFPPKILVLCTKYQPCVSRDRNLGEVLDDRLGQAYVSSAFNLTYATQLS